MEAPQGPIVHDPLSLQYLLRFPCFAGKYHFSTPFPHGAPLSRGGAPLLENWHEEHDMSETNQVPSYVRLLSNDQLDALVAEHRTRAESAETELEYYESLVREEKARRTAIQIQKTIVGLLAGG